MAKDKQVEIQLDFEKQSPNPDQGGESAQTHAPSTITTVNVKVVAPPTTPFNWKTSLGTIIGKCFLYLLLYLFLLPIALIFFIGCAIFKKELLLYESSKQSGVYKEIKEFKSMTEKMELQAIAVGARLGCVLLGWLMLTLYVPSLSKGTILGTLLWKWSLFAVIISLGHIILFVLVSYFINVLEKMWLLVAKRNVDGVSYFLDGCAYPVSLSIHCATTLLVWKLYFGTENGLKPSSRVGDVATWTLVSLVGSILGLLKRLLLLHLEANAMYKRFKPRILMAGVKQYFLTLVLDKQRRPFLLCAEDEAESGTHTNGNEAAIIDKIEDYVHSKSVPLCDIMTVAEYLMGITNAYLRGDDRVPIIQTKCQQILPTSDSGAVQETKEYLKTNFENLTDNEVQLLLELLNIEHLPNQITGEALQKWMVDAHISCSSLGHTLLDAKAMFSDLNIVLTSSIVVIVIFIWLLIMDLVTTKVVVLIASPFLASTFVFGETCKAFFQGVIFSFVRNPFDVGDHCIIDDTELEVKSIGILSTTFTKIGTKAKISYPNSDLANKRITNFEGKPNPRDLIELMLDSSTKESQISDLQEMIKCFLDDDNQRNLYEQSHQVTVKEITTNIKINIHFKHFMNLQDVTHSQYAQKKIKQRSFFLMNLKRFLEALDIKIAG